MTLWINDFDPSLSPAQLIHQTRFDAALSIVRSGYEDLIGLRDVLSPNTHLVLHAYDFAIPDGRGICNLGPWLQPTFQHRKFPNSLTVSTAVLRVMLSQFADMLTALASGHANVTFINGQGTLAPVTSSWHNELHPRSAGFNQFADLFHRQLKALFPNRLP